MPNLKVLHLGALGRWIEVTGEHLESLWNRRESHPEELNFARLHMTPDCLSALTRYKSIKALALTGCYEVKTFK